jgi:hypothetical protein
MQKDWCCWYIRGDALLRVVVEVGGEAEVELGGDVGGVPPCCSALLLSSEVAMLLSDLS